MVAEACNASFQEVWTDISGVQSHLRTYYMYVSPVDDHKLHSEKEAKTD